MRNCEDTKAHSCENVEALAREKTLGRERKDAGLRRDERTMALMNRSAEAQKCGGIVCQDRDVPDARGR